MTVCHNNYLQSGMSCKPATSGINNHVFVSIDQWNAGLGYAVFTDVNRRHCSTTVSVPEGQQQQTERDNQPKGSYNSPSENSLAIYLRKSKGMEHNCCPTGQNIVESSLSFSQKPATGLYAERHDPSSI
jgi:hypothetical protein